jgi:synaptotagmin-1
MKTNHLPPSPNPHEQRVNLELLVADYDRIGSSDPIGKVVLGYNRKGLELKHWKEMIENPRRPIVHWHVLKVKYFRS